MQSMKAFVLFRSSRNSGGGNCTNTIVRCSFDYRTKPTSPSTLRARRLSSRTHHHHHHSTTANTCTSTTATPLQENHSRSVVSSFLRWYSLRLETHPYMIKGLTSGIIAATGDVTCQFLMMSTSSSSTTTTTSEENENDTTTSSTTSNPTSNTATNPPSSSFWSSSWDSLRTLRFGLLGACYVAPGCHVWYAQLAHWFPIIHTTTIITTTTTATTTMSIWKPVLQRVVLDQWIFTPVFLVGWLFSLSTLESIMTTTPTVTTTHHHPMESHHETTTTTIIHNNPNTTTSFLERWYHTIVMDHQLLQLLYSNWILWIPVQICNFYYVPTKYQVLTSNCVAFVWNMYLSFMTSSSSSKTKSYHDGPP